MALSRSSRNALLALVAVQSLIAGAKIREIIASDIPFSRAESEFDAADNRNDIAGMNKAIAHMNDAMCASWFTSESECTWIRGGMKGPKP